LRSIISQLELLRTAPLVQSIGSITYTDHEFHTDVMNPNTTSGLTLFASTSIHVVVTRSSAATIVHRALRDPYFASKRDLMKWIKLGRPKLPAKDSTNAPLRIPPGNFSFIPRGLPITFRAAQRLPASPVVVTKLVARDLQPLYGAQVPPSALLQSYGFLLATAPVSPQAKRALWSAIARLSGAKLCGYRLRNQGVASEVTICASGAGETTAISVGLRTGRVAAIKEILDAPSSWFPTLRKGTVVQADRFIS
jgi:hypothetical protein